MQSETTGFLVTFPGDRSVGIFPQEWSINGEFVFESKEDIDTFKQKITEAFEYCSDTPVIIETIEERNAKICAGW